MFHVFDTADTQWSVVPFETRELAQQWVDEWNEQLVDEDDESAGTLFVVKV